MFPAAQENVHSDHTPAFVHKAHLDEGHGCFWVSVDKHAS